MTNNRIKEHFGFLKLNGILIIGLYTIIISSTLVGCNTNYSAITLEGTWEVVAMEADMPELSPSIIKAGEELALSTTYFFRSDNTCLITSSYYPEGYEGVWTFNKDSMTLHVKSTDEIIIDESEYAIEFASKKKIYLSEELEELGSLSMTLTKRKR